MPDKIDSNVTGLAFAEEVSPKVLPATPIWYPLEPNSYSDFGSQTKTVARNPISASRQRKRGAVVDLDASGAFNHDLTMGNVNRLLQGVFFADWREKATTQPMNSAAVTVTGATAATPGVYNAATGLAAFKVGALVLASGFTNAANNGLKTVTAAAAGALTVAQPTVLEVPTDSAKLVTCGYRFAAGAVAVALNGNLVRLNVSGFDPTTLGLIPGEWVFLGDDSPSNRFANNTGWARINVVAPTYIELDKTSWTGAVEAGTGKTISLFFGHYLQNESDPNLIKRRTYQLERTLGRDNDGTMSEYLTGAVVNEFTLNLPQADKVNIDFAFVAMDNEQRRGTEGVKAGTRAQLVSGNAINTSSDFSRIKLAGVSATDSNPTSLFGFGMEANVSIKNGVTATKGLGVLGAFDSSAGNFEVGGSMTAYFNGIDAVAAVRNNSDATFDVVLAKDSEALVFDIPMMGLGDGRLGVEADQPIKLPLEMTAGESKFKNTMSVGYFPYIPALAM